LFHIVKIDGIGLGLRAPCQSRGERRVEMASLGRGERGRRPASTGPVGMKGARRRAKVENAARTT